MSFHVGHGTGCSRRTQRATWLAASAQLESMDAFTLDSQSDEDRTNVPHLQIDVTLATMIDSRRGQTARALGRPLLVSLAMCVVLVACGDGSNQARLGDDGQEPALTHDEYQQAIHGIVRGGSDSQATQLFFAVVGDLSKNDCSDKTHALHDALAATVGQVEGLRPPAEAEAAQRAFLDAANESVRLVGVAADDVDKGALTCGTPMNQRIYGMPSTKRAEQAIDELVKLGYYVLSD